ELGAPFAMRHGNRQQGPVHALEEDGRRAGELDQREAALELLAAIAHEAWPARRARHDLLERREHLATVAHTQRERVVALEESLELVARTGVIQDGLRPALAGAQHVAVGEAAAGHEAAELIESYAPGQHVAHVH